MKPFIQFFISIHDQIVNTSTLSVQYCIKLDSQSLLRHSKAQELPGFVCTDAKTKSLVGKSLVLYLMVYISAIFSFLH